MKNIVKLLWEKHIWVLNEKGFMPNLFSTNHDINMIRELPGRNMETSNNLVDLLIQ